MLVFLFCRAGRVAGVDGWLSSLARQRRWLALVV
jgi:hypothetical protein